MNAISEVALSMHIPNALTKEKCQMALPVPIVSDDILGKQEMNVTQTIYTKRRMLWNKSMFCTPNILQLYSTNVLNQATYIKT